MLETPHQIQRRPRAASVMLSVFALLAFVCFPAFALAEDSSGLQYQDAPPTVPGKKTSEPPATSSGSGGSGGSPGKSATGSGSKDDSSRGDASDEAGGAGAGKDGSGKDGSNGPGTQAGPGQGSEASGSTPGAENASSDDGGGSPLVPILIACVVLAAISIGVVAIRRRRGDSADQGAGSSGSSVSPEAS